MLSVVDLQTGDEYTVSPRLGSRLVILVLYGGLAVAFVFTALALRIGRGRRRRRQRKPKEA
jgi:hypothetical protein